MSETPPDRLELVAELAGTRAAHACDFDRDGPRAADGEGIACGPSLIRDQDVFAGFPPAGAGAAVIAFLEPGTPDAGGAFFCERHWDRHQERHAAAYAGYDDNLSWRSSQDVIAESFRGTFWNVSQPPGLGLAGMRIEYACLFAYRARRETFERASSDPIGRAGAGVACLTRAVVWGAFEIGPGWEGSWDAPFPYCLAHWRWLADDCERTSGHARADLGRDGAGAWRTVPPEWRPTPYTRPPARPRKGRRPRAGRGRLTCGPRGCSNDT
jgi:hypothetical protein